MTVDAMRIRLRALLPPWFADDAPVLDGLLTGVATLLVFVEGFITYAKAQTRVATSTGGFLDLSAFDFFGIRFRRRAGEDDAGFQLRIRREITRPRVTRAALIQVIQDLTGRPPKLRELWNPGDCGGGYGTGGIAYARASTKLGGAGCYGSLAYPNQIFVTVSRGLDVIPNAAGSGGYGVLGCYGGGVTGTPILSGYGDPLGGYGEGTGNAYLVPTPPFTDFAGVGAYAQANRVASITDAEIHQRLAETVAAGVTAWTHIVVSPAA